MQGTQAKKSSGMMPIFAISFSGCLRRAKDNVPCSAMVCTHKLAADFVPSACESGLHELVTSHTCSFDFKTLLVRGETVGGPGHAVQVGAHMGACETPRRQGLGADTVLGRDRTDEKD